MSTAQSDSAWAAGRVPTGIVTVRDPLLRSGVPAVTNLDKVGEIFQRMVALLRQLRGAGLAASQLGIPLALVAIEVRKTTLFPARPESALIQMANPTLTPVTDERNSGDVARVVQHEIDHLNGKLFLDRMESMQTLTTVDNYIKFHHAGDR